MNDSESEMSGEVRKSFKKPNKPKRKVQECFESGNDSSEESTVSSISQSKNGNSSKTPHMTDMEKNLLMQIVSKDKFKQVVENKSTNKIWKSQKERAWKQISSEFCSNLNVHSRTGEQLRKAWENLKSRAKKQVSKVKKSRKETGGGPSKGDVSPISSRVAAIIPAQMNPMENEFDDDADVTLTIDKESDPRADDIQVKPLAPEFFKKTKVKNGNTETKRKLIASQEIIIRMEEELQEKRHRLLDLKIQYREDKLNSLKEKHETEMLILRKKLSQLDVIVFEHA